MWHVFIAPTVVHCTVVAVLHCGMFSVPPRLVQKPRDQEVTLNSRFEMECVARGVPTPIITWKLNGRPLAAPPSMNGASTVIVRHAMQEDGGEYTCVATNPANNQQVSATARVIIKGDLRTLCDKELHATHLTREQSPCVNFTTISAKCQQASPQYISSEVSFVHSYTQHAMGGGWRRKSTCV